MLSPVLAVIAVAIKLDSPGPVFFRQDRVGLYGRPFRIWKFRTMVADPSRPAMHVSPLGDPLITRVGAVLRRTFLDEWPQLLNVLAGDMSLVGPRPETPEYVAYYTEEERRTLSVLPGMAGPSTLRYSSVEGALLAGKADPQRYYVEDLLHERLALDLAYLDRMSLAYDLRILIGTAWQCVVSSLTTG